MQQNFAATVHRCVCVSLMRTPVNTWHARLRIRARTGSGGAAAWLFSLSQCACFSRHRHAVIGFYTPASWFPAVPQTLHSLLPCAATERESRTRPGGIPPLLPVVLAPKTGPLPRGNSTGNFVTKTSQTDYKTFPFQFQTTRTWPRGHAVSHR